MKQHLMRQAPMRPRLVAIAASASLGAAAWGAGTATAPPKVGMTSDIAAVDAARGIFIPQWDPAVGGVAGAQVPVAVHEAGAGAVPDLAAGSHMRRTVL